MIKPLTDLTWRDHKSALWWLGLLYRRPRRFREALATISPGRALLAGTLVLGHSLPHILIMVALLRWMLFGILDLPLRVILPPDASVIMLHSRALLIGILFGIAVGIVFGVVFGAVYGITGRIAFGIAFGITFGMVFAIAFGIMLGISFGMTVRMTPGMAFGIAGGIGIGIISGIVIGIAFGIALGTVYGKVLQSASGTPLHIGSAITFGITGGVLLGVAGGISFGIAGGIAGGSALTIALLRAYYQPLHLGFIWVLPERWYRLHPVTWDDLCVLPFPGLYHLLVAYAGVSPQDSSAEIERLVASYPSQRREALRARTTLIAREAGEQQDLARLDAIVASLPEGDKGFLAQTASVRKMVGEIAASQRRLDAIDRPFMREPYASLVVKEIENFRGRVSGFRVPLASEFRDAAEKWLAIAKRQLSEVQSIVGKEPAPQVFSAGPPIDRTQAAFVPRTNVLGDISQFIISTGCPGLLIYGRRRMGKSTLLRNLDGFLPTSVQIASISMQNPDAFTSISSLSRLIIEAVENSGIRPSAFADGAFFSDGAKWADSARNTQADDLRSLFRFLEATNVALKRDDKRFILAFDEFEQLDIKIGQGTFDKDLLATIRESIQMHRQLIWTFAGSHHITELRHAPWDSYLVSVRTIEVPPFSDAETRLLLTEPLRESPFFRDDEARRPRFDAAFWGEHGIEWVHQETGGWPHLVQLVAGTAVDLVNEANVHSLNRDMLERAADRSIIDGDVVLRQLMRGESELPGEWEYLSAFRSKDEQPPPQDEAIFQSLRHRQLITERGGMWRLRVPLMQRWLRQRG